MAIVIGTGNVISVRLGYKIDPLPDAAFNILHYQVGVSAGTPPAISAALAAIGTAMLAKWGPLWSPSAGNDVEMAGVTVTDVFPLPRSVAVTTVPGSPIPGGSTDEALPLQDAPTLLKTTDVGNRWGMGRLFYVGLSEEFADAGNVTAGQVASLNTMAAAFNDQVVVTSGGWTATLIPILVSGPEDNPVRLTPITGGRLSDTVIKSQLRRRPGKGT